MAYRVFSIILYLTLAVTSSSFIITPPTAFITIRSTTTNHGSHSSSNNLIQLKYSVIGGEGEPDEPEIDPMSVKAGAPFQKAKLHKLQTPKVAAAPAPKSLKKFNDNYEEKESGYLNSDAYSNDVSGGIVPGFRLTSLCEDD